MRLSGPAKICHKTPLARVSPFLEANAIRTSGTRSQLESPPPTPPPPPISATRSFSRYILWPWLELILTVCGSHHVARCDQFPPSHGIATCRVVHARFLRRGGARKGRETFVTPRVDRPSRYDFYDFSNVSPPFILLSLSLSPSVHRSHHPCSFREREGEGGIRTFPGFPGGNRTANRGGQPRFLTARGRKATSMATRRFMAVKPRRDSS